MGLFDRFEGDNGGNSESATHDSRDVSGGSGGDVEMDDFVEILEASADVYMAIRVVEKEVEDADTRGSKIVEEMVNDMSSQAHEFIGTFEVPQLAEKHGIDYYDEVLGELPERGR